MTADLAPTRPPSSVRRVMAGLVPVNLVVQGCSFASSVALARVLGAGASTDAYYVGLTVPLFSYGVLAASSSVLPRASF